MITGSLLIKAARFYLATAQLFQGKKEAFTLYEEWAPKKWTDDRYATYKDVFLVILEDLENEGITHPDIAKVRTILK